MESPEQTSLNTEAQSQVEWIPIWEGVMNNSKTRPVTATLSIGKLSGSPPIFSLVLKSTNGNFTNMLPLNHSEAIWIKTNADGLTTSVHSTVNKDEEVTRSLAISYVKRGDYVFMEAVSNRQGKKTLKFNVPSWKVKEFVDLVNQGLEKFGTFCVNDQTGEK